MENHRSDLNKLSKKQLVHMLESLHKDPIGSFLTLRGRQEFMMGTDGLEPCYECKFIANKLRKGRE
jgi:hypothetical protein